MAALVGRVSLRRRLQARHGPRARHPPSGGLGLRPAGGLQAADPGTDGRRDVCRSSSTPPTPSKVGTSSRLSRASSRSLSRSRADCSSSACSLTRSGPVGCAGWRPSCTGSPCSATSCLRSATRPSRSCSRLSRWNKNAWRVLVPVGVVGALLAAFWLVPFAADLRYSSSMGYTRVTGVWSNIMPRGYLWMIIPAGRRHPDRPDPP